MWNKGGKGDGNREFVGKWKYRNSSDGSWCKRAGKRNKNWNRRRLKFNKCDICEKMFVLMSRNVQRWTKIYLNFFISQNGQIVWEINYLYIGINGN